MNQFNLKKNASSFSSLQIVRLRENIQALEIENRFY